MHAKLQKNVIAFCFVLVICSYQACSNPMEADFATTSLSSTEENNQQSPPTNPPTEPNSLARPMQLTTPVLREALCVTNGDFIRLSNPTSFAINAPTTRAVVTPTTQHQAVKIDFEYHGQVENPDGHYQIGIKLLAQNTCNTLYVMWPVAGGPLKVTIKKNVGLIYHSQCGPTGYTNYISDIPEQAAPALVLGDRHKLQAELNNNLLNVFIDEKLAWQKQFTTEQLDFTGPVGMRSDGGQFIFSLYTTFVEPVIASSLNLSKFNSYSCATQPSVAQ